MSSRPYENSLTVNGTHQQLRHLNSWRAVAIAPPRTEEGRYRQSDVDEGGFDTMLETAKEIAFQYKRAKETVTHGGTDYLKYELDMSQVEVLSEQFLFAQSFIALPVVPSYADLSDMIYRTIFIDPNLILKYSRPRYGPSDADTFNWVYIQHPEDTVASSQNPVATGAVDIHLKYNSRQGGFGGPSYRPLPIHTHGASARSLAQSGALTWLPLKRYINRCWGGTAIRGADTTERFVAVPESLERLLPVGTPETLAEPYRHRVARTQALVVAAEGGTEGFSRSELVAAIADDLKKRQRVAQELADNQEGGGDRYDLEIRAAELVERFWGRPTRLQRSVGKIRRNIIEQGRIAERLVIR